MSNEVTKYQGTALIGNRATLKGLFENPAIKQMFAEGVAKAMTPQRVAKMALTVAMNNPALLRCSQESVIKSLIEAAQLGLDCSGTLGQAYLVPYGKRCQMLIGYSGLITLAHRSGQVKGISAHLVYQDEVDSGAFTYEAGIEPKLIHRPDLSKMRPVDDKAINSAYCVYAVAQMQGGFNQHVVMSVGEVESIKKMSSAAKGKFSPWKPHWVEMAKKTVIRRLMKMLPMSIENENLTAAIESDNNSFDLDPAEVEEISFDSMDDLPETMPSGTSENVGKPDFIDPPQDNGDLFEEAK